jgi:DNA-binding transcriptional MerR regulator
VADVDDNELYPIGDVARRTGLSISAIRFYADTGVVTSSTVTAAGHRLYDIQAVARLELVRTLRELGASLDDIRQLLTDNVSLQDLAATHLAVVEGQMRRLRARQAVLRAILRQDNSTEQVALMHKLVSMSDDDRERLLDLYWNEITEGLTVHPAFVELMHRWRPRLPAEPTVEQLEAWIELADLVQDEDYRRSLGAAFRTSFSSDHSHAVTSPEVLDRIERHRQILREARETREAGLLADSVPAREVSERLAASAAEISRYARANGLTGPPRQNGKETHARFMGLLSRYGTLVAAINGIPQLDPAGAAQLREWLAAARRDG